MIYTSTGLYLSNGYPHCSIKTCLRISVFFQIRASRGSRAFHCLQSRYTGRKRRGCKRFSTSFSSEEEGRLSVAFITGMLRFSGLEDTLVEVLGLFTGVTIVIVREDEIDEKVGVDNRAGSGEKSFFLFFFGVSGRGVSMSIASLELLFCRSPA